MSLWTLLGFDEANSQAAADADAKLQALNAADYGPGGKYYTPATAAAVESNRASELANGAYGVDAQGNQIEAVFKSELDSQAKGIFGTPLNLTGDVIVAFLKSIPWWVWAGAVGVTFVYLGGGKWLVKIIRRKAEA